MRYKIFFALYDFWIGAFWDRKNKILYICPIPCVVIKIETKIPPLKDPLMVKYALDSAESKLYAISELTSDLYDSLHAVRKEIDG